MRRDEGGRWSRYSLPAMGGPHRAEFAKLFTAGQTRSAISRPFPQGAAIELRSGETTKESAGGRPTDLRPPRGGFDIFVSL
jgi:hypothetical protein